MKRFVFLATALLALATIFSQTVWAQKNTCSNLWIVNNTLASQVPSSVDLLFVDRLERRLKATERICYHGYAKFGGMAGAVSREKRHVARIQSRHIGRW